MSLALASRRAAISPAWVKNPLWRTARAVPSLDQPFADTKSLVDAVTGQSLVTFTRASSGTYVGSDGLLKTATTNLLLRSEEFDNASWARERLLSVTANAEIAPNGYLVAERIVEDSTASNTHTIYQAVAGLPDSTTFTFSVYLKAAGRTKAVVAFMDKSGTTRGMLFDLSQGTISSFNLNGIVDPTASNIVAIGNGWYRCSVQQSSGTGAFGPRCWVQLVSGSTNSYTGDGTSGLLLWGAQLEQSSTVGEYIPTTSTINSAPRFDHNPTTGESLGLLVEEQRTNLLLNSATLSTQSVTVTAAAHTLSFTGTGTITLSGASTAGPLVGTGTGEGNRVSLTFIPTAGTLTLTVSGTASNAQLEVGSFRTSYIPTTTATATRSADVASITGTAFSSWYRQDEGTVFADVISAPVSNVAQLAYDISEGVGNERLFQRRNASGFVGAAVVDNGVTQGDIGSVAISASARYRSGFAYKLNDLEIVVNGGGSVTDTSATLPTLDRIHIGQNYASGQSCNGTIRRLVFFPQRLPNSTLQAITR